jgi:hypothetical protein
MGAGLLLLDDRLFFGLTARRNANAVEGQTTPPSEKGITITSSTSSRSDH